MLNISTRFKTLLLFICCAWLWQGCNIINPHEPTPTYIHIDSFSFQQNPDITVILAGAGSVPSPYLPTLSHQITSVWVYYNGSRVGIFDLPVTFPVIATGSGKLEVVPAVAIDGRNNNVSVYPFYAPDTSTLVAQPGKVINYTPKTKFYSGVKVTAIDYFKGKASFNLARGNRYMKYVTDDSLVFEGGPNDGSGEISLLAVGDSSVDSSSNYFAIRDGVSVIEFNYKSTIPFYVGLQANLSAAISSSPYYLSGINPSAEWQKFYLLVNGFTAQAGASSYNFYIKAVLADGQSSGRLLIDNVQVVTF